MWPFRGQILGEGPVAGHSMLADDQPWTDDTMYAEFQCGQEPVSALTPCGRGPWGWVLWGKTKVFGDTALKVHPQDTLLGSGRDLPQVSPAQGWVTLNPGLVPSDRLLPGHCHTPPLSERATAMLLRQLC